MDSVSICIYNSFKRVIDTEEYIKKNYTTDFFEWLSRLFGPAFGAGPTAWQLKANGLGKAVGAPKRTLRVRIAAHTALNFKLRAKAACCGTLYGPRVIINRNHETVAVDVEPIWTQAIVYFNDLTAVEFHVRDDIAEAVVLHVLKELLGSEAKFNHGLHLVAPALRADAFLGMGFPGFPDKAIHEAVAFINEIIDAADGR